MFAWSAPGGRPQLTLLAACVAHKQGAEPGSKRKQSAAAKGVTVFNAPFSNTRSVAEKTMAEVVALQAGPPCCVPGSPHAVVLIECRQALPCSVPG